MVVEEGLEAGGAGGTFHTAETTAFGLEPKLAGDRADLDVGRGGLFVCYYFFGWVCGEGG